MQLMILAAVLFTSVPEISPLSTIAIQKSAPKSSLVIQQRKTKRGILLNASPYYQHYGNFNGYPNTPLPSTYPIATSIPFSQPFQLKPQDHQFNGHNSAVKPVQELPLQFPFQDLQIPSPDAPSTIPQALPLVQEQPNNAPAPSSDPNAPAFYPSRAPNDYATSASYHSGPSSYQQSAGIGIAQHHPNPTEYSSHASTPNLLANEQINPVSYGSEHSKGISVGSTASSNPEHTQTSPYYPFKQSNEQTYYATPTGYSNHNYGSYHQNGGTQPVNQHQHHHGSGGYHGNHHHAHHQPYNHPGKFPAQNHPHTYYQTINHIPSLRKFPTYSSPKPHPQPTYQYYTSHLQPVHPQVQTNYNIPNPKQVYPYARYIQNQHQNSSPNLHHRIGVTQSAVKHTPSPSPSTTASPISFTTPSPSPAYQKNSPATSHININSKTNHQDDEEDEDTTYPHRSSGYHRENEPYDSDDEVSEDYDEKPAYKPYTRYRPGKPVVDDEYEEHAPARYRYREEFEKGLHSGRFGDEDDDDASESTQRQAKYRGTDGKKPPKKTFKGGSKVYKYGGLPGGKGHQAKGVDPLEGKPSKNVPVTAEHRTKHYQSNWFISTVSDTDP